MKKIIFYTLILTLLASGARVSAEAGAITSYTLLEPLPCIGSNCTGAPLTKININDYIGYVFKFALALAVLLATVMIIYGGFEYMLSEIPSVKVDAKGRITNAIYGLVMAFASYLILQTIDPRLVQVNTTIDPVGLKGDSLLFNNQLQQSNTLSLSNSVANQRTSDLNDKIVDLSSKKRQLQERYLYNSDPSSENHISDEDYQLQLGTLNSQINAASSEITQIKANTNMGTRFLGAISEIEDGRATADSTKRLVDGINTSWSQSLAKPEISSDPQARATLLFQKDFRIAQINEEQKLRTDLEYYKEASSGLFSGANSNMKIRSLELPLEATLVKYNDELTFLSTSDDRVSSTIKDDTKLHDDLIKLKKGDPVLSQEYQKVLQSRVTLISASLPPPNKK